MNYTYQGNPVLFHGTMKEAQMDESDFSYQVTAVGLEGFAKISEESATNVDFAIDKGILVVNYSAGGTDFWTLCLATQLDEDNYFEPNSDVEQMIAALDLTAPRITPEHIEHCVKAVEFHVFPGSSTTVCCLTLQNNFTVVGTSACASPENFNEKLGRTIAYKAAKGKIGQFEGYLLCQALANKGDYNETE